MSFISEELFTHGSSAHASKLYEPTENAREIYEQCISTLGETYIDQNIYVSFAKFEIRCKELERARAIFKYALEKLDKEKSTNLYNSYTQFEKQYGGQEGIEDVVISKRRVQYEEVFSMKLLFVYFRKLFPLTRKDALLIIQKIASH